MIDAFRGKYMKLSNYSLVTIMYEGHAYMSVEHAYQAQKTTDPVLQKQIRDSPTPATAKKLARSVPLRPDWEEVKVPIMLQLLREKFAQEPERTILMTTYDEELVEGNWWNDTFWGVCNGVGENMLGKLLMKVRQELWEELAMDGGSLPI